MVGGSSILASPAFAVEREIVGRDNEGALIIGDGLFRRYCCCAATAERRAACADCCSFVFGEEEKNCDNLFGLDAEGLLALSADGVATAGVVVEVANGFLGSL